MATKGYRASSLIGGGAGALDAIDGDLLTDLDMAIVTTLTTTYTYTLDDDGAGAESSPDRILPDTNPGTKVWLLTGITTNGQITFPAIQNASAGVNVLDDYEEGTWTPVVADDPTAGNTGDAGTKSGLYRKVGGLVSVSFTLITIDTTGMTAGNDFYIRDLPFAALATVINVGSISADNITFAEYLTLHMIASSTVLRLWESASGAAGDYVIVSQVADDSGDIYGTLTYPTTT